MLKVRNELAHDYDGEIVKEHCQAIVQTYIDLFYDFEKTVKSPRFKNHPRPFSIRFNSGRIVHSIVTKQRPPPMTLDTGSARKTPAVPIWRA